MCKSDTYVRPNPADMHIPTVPCPFNGTYPRVPCLPKLLVQLSTASRCPYLLCIRKCRSLPLYGRPQPSRPSPLQPVQGAESLKRAECPAPSRLYRLNGPTIDEQAGGHSMVMACLLCLLYLRAGMWYVLSLSLCVFLLLTLHYFNGIDIAAWQGHLSQEAAPVQ